MKRLPFTEHFINEKESHRHFSKNINEEEMEWHRDKEDRLISPLQDNDWYFQLDNQLPTSIDKEIFIPKETFHRGIKGTTDLDIKVKRIL